MKSFEQQIREYYRSRKLDEDLARELLGGTTPDRASVLKGRWRSIVVVTLGLVGLIGLVGLSWSNWFSGRLATEIAVNHIKRENMQVQTQHYEVVQAKLSRLDFPLLPTRPDLVDSYDLVGGRYCSLGGSPAAQLRLRPHGEDGFVTLYVARLGKRTHGVRHRTTNEHGVRVELWSENGLVYGLACDERSWP